MVYSLIRRISRDSLLPISALGSLPMVLECSSQSAAVGKLRQREPSQGTRGMGMVGSDEPQTLFDVLHDSQHVLSESRQRQCRKLSRNSRNAPPILALPMTDFPAILLCENCVSLCAGMIMFAICTPDFGGVGHCPSAERYLRFKTPGESIFAAREHTR